jgi:hypothetical protein
MKGATVENCASATSPPSTNKVPISGISQNFFALTRKTPHILDYVKHQNGCSK